MFKTNSRFCFHRAIASTFFSFFWVTAALPQAPTQAPAQAPAPASAASSPPAKPPAKPATQRDRAWQILRDGIAENSAEKRAHAVRALGLLPGNAEAEKSARAALKD